MYVLVLQDADLRTLVVSTILVPGERALQKSPAGTPAATIHLTVVLMKVSLVIHPQVSSFPSYLPHVSEFPPASPMFGFTMSFVKY